jgi:yeast amino acid transporter
MDHEKPQAVSPQIFEFGGEATQSTYEPEIHYERPPSIEEPTQVKERRERRGESVW